MKLTMTLTKVKTQPKKVKFWLHLPKDTHCGYSILLFSCIILHMPCHTQDASGYNQIQVYSDFIIIIFFSVFEVKLYDCISPIGKLSDNLNAKCMMKRSWELMARVCNNNIQVKRRKSKVSWMTKRLLLNIPTFKTKKKKKNVEMSDEHRRNQKA